MTEITDKTDVATCLAHRVATAGGPGADVDDRFCRLLPAAAWSSLPAVVRRRFSQPVPIGGRRLFAGAVVLTWHSRIGLVLARLARLVGGPLPDTRGATGPSLVVVTREETRGGQVWTRTYARPGRQPQTITSVKRFAGPTGLEEDLGHGLLMRLTLDAAAGALVFRSAGYDLVLGRRRLPLPHWLSPGACTITHRDEGGRGFSFALTLDHPRLGRLVHQLAFYEEITP
jgi:hypothetical protein